MMVVILEMMVVILQTDKKSQYPFTPFTGENDFTHVTQDEDHEFRRAGPGIGAIGKPYRG